MQVDVDGRNGRAIGMAPSGIYSLDAWMNTKFAQADSG
jgi:hypothetical protein